MKKIVIILFLLIPVCIFSQADKIKPLNSKEAFNSFLESKATIKWKAKEFKKVSAPLIKIGLTDKEYCKLASIELSKHMNYQDFNKLTNYQQGNLMGKLVKYVENKEVP